MKIANNYNLPRSISFPLASIRLTGRLLTIFLAFWFTKEAGDRFTTPSVSSLIGDDDCPAFVVGGAAIAQATAMAKIF